jgi:hypothetical protein
MCYSVLCFSNDCGNTLTLHKKNKKGKKVLRALLNNAYNVFVK